MFERIDKEDDGEVYVHEVIDFLRVMDDNMEQNDEVKDRTCLASVSCYFPGKQPVHALQKRVSKSAAI